MRDLSLIALICLVLVIQKQRRRSYLTKLSLTLPCKSAWQALLTAKQDAAYIDTMGFDVASFTYLHDAVKNRIWVMDVKDRGRTPTLDTKACLGKCHVNTCMSCGKVVISQVLLGHMSLVM